MLKDSFDWIYYSSLKKIKRKIKDIEKEELAEARKRNDNIPHEEVKKIILSK